jgi:hypothetical protein
VNEQRRRVKEKKQTGSKRVKYKERGENKGKTGMARVKIYIMKGGKNISFRWGKGKKIWVSIPISV